MSVPCPNCGMPWPGDAEVCPNCGYIRPAVPAWPPTPAGQSAPSLPPAPKLVTGKPASDLVVGIVLSFASNFLACLGFVVMPILYFTLKPKYPVFARGLGYGTLAGVAVLLGALGWCLFSVINPHG